MNVEQEIRETIQSAMQTAGARPVCFANMEPLVAGVMAVVSKLSTGLEEIKAWGQRVEPPVLSKIYDYFGGGLNWTQKIQEPGMHAPRSGIYLGRNWVLADQEYTPEHVPAGVVGDQINYRIRQSIGAKMWLHDESYPTKEAALAAIETLKSIDAAKVLQDPALLPHDDLVLTVVKVAEELV